MSPEQANTQYQKEWPALNAIKLAAVDRGDIKAGKRARQALNALSIKYRDRHIPPYQPPTIAERLEELESRVTQLEKESL